jgi:hypothetical protein
LLARWCVGEAGKQKHWGWWQGGGRVVAGSSEHAHHTNPDPPAAHACSRPSGSGRP